MNNFIILHFGQKTSCGLNFKALFKDIFLENEWELRSYEAILFRYSTTPCGSGV
jgi:hypothetical protein